MAPMAARMPWRIWAPSSAGPAGAEHAHSRSREPSRTSPLVPMSTAMRRAGDSSMRVASATATASAPTKPATIGSRHTRASGGSLRKRSRAGSVSGWRITGA